MREKLWVVRPGDGTTVAEIVARAGERPDAVADGRVFVGPRRVTSAAAPVRPGDRVRIGAPRPTATTRVEVLFERDDLVAVVKPAGLPTVPDHDGGAHALVAQVAAAVGARELRVTSRLDRDVSGVVVFARTAAAEARLKEARARGAYERRYVAIAQGGDRLEGEAGEWASPIDDKPSTSRWRAVARAGGLVLLAVDPVTGRTHQIRIHASRAGAPLVGDPTYGGPARLVLADGRVLAPGRIALHAARVVVPGRDGPIEARAPVPRALSELWAALGGEDEAWDRATR